MSESCGTRASIAEGRIVVGRGGGTRTTGLLVDLSLSLVFLAEAPAIAPLLGAGVLLLLGGADSVGTFENREGRSDIASSVVIAVDIILCCLCRPPIPFWYSPRTTAPVVRADSVYQSCARTTGAIVRAVLEVWQHRVNEGTPCPRNI